MGFSSSLLPYPNVQKSLKICRRLFEMAASCAIFQSWIVLSGLTVYSEDNR
jgi:hypothetical protein